MTPIAVVESVGAGEDVGVGMEEAGTGESLAARTGVKEGAAEGVEMDESTREVEGAEDEPGEEVGMTALEFDVGGTGGGVGGKGGMIPASVVCMDMLVIPCVLRKYGSKAVGLLACSV